jgi:ribosome-associated heat shock protein Hsp15
MRIDLWLFRARLVRSRAAAADLLASAGVRIEHEGQVRRSEKPSTEIMPGDMLSVASPSGQRVLRILALPARRGPASEARACYEIVAARGDAGEEDPRE